MKLLGRINKETGYVMASIAHHDFRDEYGMMVDGGQPHCQDYAGYTRFNGKTEWFEVPQSFNELFDDYQTNTGKRKYGVWELKDVRILSEKEYPDVDSDEVLFENMCWELEERTEMNHSNTNFSKILNWIILKPSLELNIISVM